MGVRIARDLVATACHCLPPDEQGRPTLPAARGPGVDTVFVELSDLSCAMAAKMLVCAADPCSDLVLLGSATQAADLECRDAEMVEALFRKVPAARAEVSPAPSEYREVSVLTHDQRWVEGKAWGTFIELNDPSQRIEGGTSGSAVFDTCGNVIGVVVTDNGEAPSATMCLLSDALPGWVLQLLSAEDSGGTVKPRPSGSASSPRSQ
jgi:hypothetical protein